MKKVLLLLLILITNVLYSIEYNTYDMNIEFIFSASNKGLNSDLDLAVNNNPGGGDSLGPSFLMFKESMLLFDEAGKYRAIYLEKDYKFKNILEFCIYDSHYFIFDENIIGFNSSQGISVIYKDELIINIDFFELDFLRGSLDLYYQDNTLFIFDKDYKLWAIKNPGLYDDENRNNIISEDEIIQEINSGKYKGLTIDSKKRLFLHDKLMTVDIKTYVEYCREIRSLNNKPINSFENSEGLYIKGNASYIGADNDGNKYWYQGSALLIFNSNGWPIEDFVVSEWEKVNTYPAVSPEGDVYFMNYGDDNVTLYKVDRKW